MLYLKFPIFLPVGLSGYGYILEEFWKYPKALPSPGGLALLGARRPLCLWDFWVLVAFPTEPTWAGRVRLSVRSPVLSASASAGALTSPTRHDLASMFSHACLPLDGVLLLLSWSPRLPPTQVLPPFWPRALVEGVPCTSRVVEPHNEGGRQDSPPGPSGPGSASCPLKDTPRPAPWILQSRLLQLLEDPLEPRGPLSTLCLGTLGPRRSQGLCH